MSVLCFVIWVQSQTVAHLQVFDTFGCERNTSEMRRIRAHFPCWHAHGLESVSAVLCKISPVAESWLQSSACPSILGVHGQTTDQSATGHTQSRALSPGVDQAICLPWLCGIVSVVLREKFPSIPFIFNKQCAQEESFKSYSQEHYWE